MKWDEAREKFVRLALAKGVYRMAKKIPADPETVYRMIRGGGKRTTLAIRVAVERVVMEEEKKQ